MTPTPEAQELIRRYLLGQLSEGVREKFEQDLLTSDDLFQELLVIEDELVDEYLAGKLNVEDRISFEQHFLATPERHEKLNFGRAFDKYLSSRVSSDANAINLTPARSQWGWGQFLSSPLRLAVVAIAVLLLGFGVWRIFFHQSEVDKGLLALNAAYRQRRPIEARISRLDYAPFAETRGSGGEAVDQDELRLAELTLIEAKKRNQSAAAHHALGRVFLAERQFDKAIAEFDEALKGDSNNAQLRSDLGAAWLEKGRLDRGKRAPNENNSPSGNGMEDFARSLDNLNKAVELDPRLLEALFNRALLDEAMVLPKEAEADWKRYLAQDSNSKWADEARRHLNELEERNKTRSQKKAELLPEFFAAYKSGDDNKAYELISQNTEAIAGRLLWWQLAGAYLDAASRQDLNGADEYLKVLIYSGALQEKKFGDRFVSELARFYASCGATDRASLIEAHATLDQAHALMSKSNAAQAFPLYEKAKARFDKAGDKWESLFTSYWIGYGHYREEEFKESLSILTQLADSCKEKSYLWLVEKAAIAIGTIRVYKSDFSAGLQYQNQSLEVAEKINDPSDLQKALSVLAFSYRDLGNSEESFGYLQRCLESARNRWPGSRQMYRNYFATAGILNSFGYYPAAAKYAEASLGLALEDGDPVLANQSYVALAAIATEQRSFGEALEYANLGYDAVKEVDERTGLKPNADAFLQLGHVNRLIGSYDNAITNYQKAAKLFDQEKYIASFYEAHKGMLLTEFAQHDNAHTEKELQVVLALLKDNRAKIREERNRNSFFDLAQDVYDTAIDFEFARGEHERAFDYSEYSRARSLFDLMRGGGAGIGDEDLEVASKNEPLTHADIRRRMPEGVEILQYAVLQDKLLTWIISRDKFQFSEKKISSDALTEIVLRYCKSLSSISSDAKTAQQDGIELYKILIEPIESKLDKHKRICVIADKVLNRLPFYALISPSTGKYLITEYTVSFAPSSTVFIAASDAAQDRRGKKDENALSVGNPSFDPSAFPGLADLRSSAVEAEKIASLYHGEALTGDRATKERVLSELSNADVVNIASHYIIDERNPMLSKLLLAGSTNGRSAKDPSDGVLHAYEIYRTKLPNTRLVVLSACSTGVERYYSGEGMIGMSRTFLANNVPLVAASLWPVSASTADLITNFHRYRKEKSQSSIDALRQAQLDMLDDPQGTYSQPYYWAGFVLIGGNADF